MRTRGLCLLAIMISSPERTASISPDNFAFASCICTVLNEIQKSKKKYSEGGSSHATGYSALWIA